MMRRSISAAEVGAVLATPEGRIRQTKDKWIFYGRIPGRKDNLIAVVAVVTEGNPTQIGEILTVMNHFEAKNR